MDPAVTITPDTPAQVTITPDQHGNAPGTITGDTASIGALPSQQEQAFRPYQGGFVDRATSFLGENLRNMGAHPIDTLKSMIMTPARIMAGDTSAGGEMADRFKMDPAATAGDIGTAALLSTIMGKPPGFNLSGGEDFKPQLGTGTWSDPAAALREVKQRASLSAAKSGEALGSIRKAAATPESPYQVVQLQGVKANSIQGKDPFSGPRAPAQMEPAQSTTIDSHGYHADSQTMTVKFKNGNVYQLRGVPEKVYQQYQQSESQGSFYSNNLKGRYETRLVGKIQPTPGQQVKNALSGPR